MTTPSHLCGNCGTRLDLDESFCSGCGRPRQTGSGPATGARHSARRLLLVAGGVLACLLTAVLVLTRSGSDPSSMAGKWTGSITVGGYEVPLEVELPGRGMGQVGTVTYPQSESCEGWWYLESATDETLTFFESLHSSERCNHDTRVEATARPGNRWSLHLPESGLRGELRPVDARG